MTIIHVNGLIKQEVPQHLVLKKIEIIRKSLHFHIFKENRNNSKIITFSHFLTSKKLMKAYIDEMSLRRQQWLDSRKVHIFAHSQNGIGYWSWYSIYK
ncbi:unnamed protein product [Rotaria socialis]